jgi:hypothetical protein
VLFEWTGYGNTAATGRTFTLTVATDPACTQVVARQEGLRWPRAVVPPLLKGGQGGVLAPGQTYYWKVTATNPHGTVESLPGPRPFSVDAALENTVEEELALYELGERSLMAASPLDGDGTPSHGILESAVGITPAADRFGREGSAVAFGGEGCAIKYRLPYFPEDHFTFYAWVYPEGLPTDRLHQVFSAWATGMDDPLRVVFDGPALFARIEARGVYGTAGVPAENGRWIHVATVKEGPRLSLYVDGELKQTADAPEWVFSAATDFALGANPHYGGNECFVGRIDDFAFHAQAFTAEEIAAVYRR